MHKSDEIWGLAERLHSAAIHLLRRLRVQDLASGVGPAKLSALSALVFSKRPLSLSELATAEQVKNPTMSRLVSAMERDGLVTTETMKSDARSIHITPTDRGKNLLLAGKKRRVDSLAKAIGALNESQLKEMENATTLFEEIVRKL
jgi:DNA-binding MarR family transcriptional regulator